MSQTTSSITHNGGHIVSSEQNQSEKKIIIDEDWKSQVEAEKAAARHEEHPAEPQAEASAAHTHHSMPPASLSFLVSSFYLQGAIALGVMPNPLTNKQERHLDQAKYAIDMLAMLQQKTEGNRTSEESEELEAALHELRLAYVGLQNS
jgi:hypothetical protein